MSTGFAVLAALIILYAAVANKLSRWSITMPMVFVLIGVVLGGVTNLLPISPQAEPMKALTEVTLALLLFADASTLKLKEISSDAAIPARLLTIGLLLTILAGAGVALLLAPQEGVAFAFLLGAILAPTDAALGLPIFNDPRVPVRVRRALNIESGLNDGIATPFVLLFLSFATATVEGQASGSWLSNALIEIVLAILAAVVVGALGGWLLSLAARRHWTGGVPEQLAILGLALAAYFGSLAIGGNGFIAAFVGGIVFRATARDQLVESTEFTETLGAFLSLLVWAVFGAVLVTKVVSGTTSWKPILYAILSLTAIRMVPVALALLGTRLRRDTVSLMGWFGPRGLASVVFTLLALESFTEASIPVETLLAAATWTILLSVLAHGLSATPLAVRYARRLGAAEGPIEELADAPELRQRRRMLDARHPPS